MKKNYLFCTRIKMYLLELPLIALLVITCIYNGKSESVFRLYPLIVFLCAAIVFILVYFFRAISISFEEVRYHGLFSSRDHAPINKDKEIIFTLEKRRRIRVELFGNDGKAPELDWINESDEDYKPLDIYLFRGKAMGGKRKISKLLYYYGVSREDIPTVFSSDSFSHDYEFVTLTSERREDIIEIKLKMKETV